MANRDRRYLQGGAVFAESLSDIDWLRQRYTVNGKPSIVKSPYGPALFADGTNDDISLGTNLFTSAQLVQGTMMIRINLSSPKDSIQQRIFSVEGVIRIVYDEDFPDHFQGTIFDGGDVNLDGGFIPKGGKWYDLAMTWNGTNIFLYSDGIEVDSAAQGSPALDGLNRDSRIGASFGGGNRTKGALRDAIIFPWQSSEAELLNFHNNEAF